MTTTYTYEQTTYNGVMDYGFYGYRDGEKMSPGEAEKAWKDCHSQWEQIEHRHWSVPGINYWEVNMIEQAVKNQTDKLPFARTDWKGENGNHLQITYTLKAAPLE